MGCESITRLREFLVDKLTTVVGTCSNFTILHLKDNCDLIGHDFGYNAAMSRVHTEMAAVSGDELPLEGHEAIEGELYPNVFELFLVLCLEVLSSLRRTACSSRRKRDDLRLQAPHTSKHELSRSALESV